MIRASRKFKVSRAIVTMAVIVMVAMLSGCAFSPFRQFEALPFTAKPLRSGEVSRTRASDDIKEAAGDGRFIGLALAGGGSRAAVFSGEILCELHELGVMRRVDFISGISSGSMAGAYYCASYDSEEAEGGDLVWRRDLTEELMRRGVWLEYFTRYLNPANLLRYYGTGLNRSYQMRRVIDQQFFSNKTFADLNPLRPRLLITATTLETGAVFTFTDRQLAELGIRSKDLKISDAVQASSSFPGLFHPYVLPQFEMTNGKTRVKQHVHLVDGGVYDNLGVTPLLNIYQANRSQFPRGGIIIVADASLPVAIKTKLAAQADIRGVADYVVDFGTIRKSIEIMFEVDRLGLMRTLREDAGHLGLKVVHLHYTTGVLSTDDHDLHDELPNILDLDLPVPTNVDFGGKHHLVAPTALRISERHAKATREAARRVIQFNLADLKSVLESN
jgi:predicted acylesterase/phospholipase RssA